ncbi:MAG: hypothetical protein CMM50_08350 [Rhodospirillaceae bacterium]|nr:hypothetical protein [Rhodospirillaceae bacterium]
MLLLRRLPILTARIAAILLLGQALPDSGVTAQTLKHNSSQPIEIIADAMEWQQEQRIAIARGHADAVQGEYRLRADQLTAYLGDAENGTGANGGAGNGDGGDALGEIRRIDATGNVFLSTPRETAQGSAGVYDVVNGVVVLTGNVVLTRDDNIIRGERLVLDLESGKSRIESPNAPGTTTGADGRVRALFLPQNAKEKPQ